MLPPHPAHGRAPMMLLSAACRHNAGAGGCARMRRGGGGRAGTGVVMFGLVWRGKKSMCAGNSLQGAPGCVPADALHAVDGAIVASGVLGAAVAARVLPVGQAVAALSVHPAPARAARLERRLRDEGGEWRRAGERGRAGESPTNGNQRRRKERGIDIVSATLFPAGAR